MSEPLDLAKATGGPDPRAALILRAIREADRRMRHSGSPDPVEITRDDYSTLFRWADGTNALGFVWGARRVIAYGALLAACSLAAAAPSHPVDVAFPPGYVLIIDPPVAAPCDAPLWRVTGPGGPFDVLTIEHVADSFGAVLTPNAERIFCDGFEGFDLGGLDLPPPGIVP